MPTSSKIKISPGQGLLLLIDYHQKNKSDELTVSRLKALYLRGAENSSEVDEIKNLLNHSCLSKYEVSYEIKVINDDPTRRYFETHLAYESLKHGLSGIKTVDLQQQFDALFKMIPDDKKDDALDDLNGAFSEEYVLGLENRLGCA